MIYKGFTALFPLITTSYISRVLLPAGVGRVGYANTIVAYFVLIVSLGIPTYGVKAIAQSGETKGGAKPHLLGTVFYQSCRDTDVHCGVLCVCGQFSAFCGPEAAVSDHGSDADFKYF